jgi:magnesium chelatase family protein
MLSVVCSGSLIGIHALPVQVEVNTGEAGELRFILVGLPDAAVKESQDRVFSALSNCGFRIPATRTTINLAPGNIRKEGPMYDLPIALGLLAASRQIASDNLENYIIAGELSLSGKTSPIKGALALAMLAKKEGKMGVLLPKKSAEEAALVEGIPVFPIDSLDQAVRFITGEIDIAPITAESSPFIRKPQDHSRVDFSEIKGQKALRRAVEVAVAGGHNLLMIGSPGSGKSMIAKRIPSIMPNPTLDEFLEILSIQSAAGITLSEEGRCFQRPFRSPHHTISDVGLLGGGSIPGPGEISLSHNGVLFMDELPEFKRSALEVLRQPLEDGHVTISRSAGKITLPSSFMLVAAMNPCPCGYLGDPKRECRCTAPNIQRYRGRISGPLLDRIDIHIEANTLSIEELQSQEQGETSIAMATRIENARKVQHERINNSNARMSHKQIRAYCATTKEQDCLLQQAMEQLNLSARAYDRILKVSRTIADLEGSQDIETPHLLEAIQYRTLDRNTFY